MTPTPLHSMVLLLKNVVSSSPGGQTSRCNSGVISDNNKRFDNDEKIDDLQMVIPSNALSIFVFLLSIIVFIG